MHIALVTRINVVSFSYSCGSYRDALRNNCNEEDMLNMIGAAVKRKKKQHAGECYSIFLYTVGSCWSKIDGIEQISEYKIV